MTEAAPPLDHCFRQHYGPLVSGVARWLGGRIELAEDAVCEAMCRAVRAWPVRGVPDNPGGWLHRVARRCAIDQLRCGAALEQLPEIPVAAAEPADDELADDALRLVVLCCCVPGLPRLDRVALTLQLAGGFGAAQIARAFRMPEAGLAQRLVRAKRRLRALPATRFGLPPAEALADRLDEVLDVLYLTFNEGYTPSDEDAVLRQDVVDEAIRLVGLLLDQPFGQAPKVHALAALMLLQSSRLPARIDAGVMVTLEAQDRSRWNRARIDLGLEQLALAAVGSELSDYHLLADIAALHATSVDSAATDWPRILALYEALGERGQIATVSWAVAVGMVHGWGQALALLGDQPRTVYDEYVLAAARGECLRRLGRRAEAAERFARAAALAPSEAERRYFLGRR